VTSLLRADGLSSVSRPEVARATVVPTDGARRRCRPKLLSSTATSEARPRARSRRIVEAEPIDAAREVIASCGPVAARVCADEDLAWKTARVRRHMWVLSRAGGRDDRCPSAGRPISMNLVRASSSSLRSRSSTLGAVRGRDVSFAGRAFVDAAADHRQSGRSGDRTRVPRPRGGVKLRHGSRSSCRASRGWILLGEPVRASLNSECRRLVHVALRAVASFARSDFAVTILDDLPLVLLTALFCFSPVIPSDFAVANRVARLRVDGFVVIATRGTSSTRIACWRRVILTARYIAGLCSRRQTVLIATMLREAGVGERRSPRCTRRWESIWAGRTPAEIALGCWPRSRNCGIGERKPCGVKVLLF